MASTSRTYSVSVTPFIFALLSSVAFAAPATKPANGPTKPAWPPGVKDIRYHSTADSSEQPALWYNPPGAEPRPLLVALHTWSGDYKQTETAYAHWCVAKGWAMIQPNFRGANDHPEACGSELAIADVLSAVEFAKQTTTVIPDRVYLVGASGGGHMAMLLAGRSPKTWAAVSAWCGISDLRLWHEQTKQRKLHYWEMLEKVCGGAPGLSSQVDAQYVSRSPVSHLNNAIGLPLDINTGIEDGHKGSVPIGHSLRAFNRVVVEADRIPEDLIESLEASPKMPADLRQAIEDPSYVKTKCLYRKVSGNARVTIIQAGHTIIPEAALAWLEQQRQGKPSVWKIEKPTVDLGKSEIKK